MNGLKKRAADDDACESASHEGQVEVEVLLAERRYFLLHLPARCRPLARDMGEREFGVCKFCALAVHAIKDVNSLIQTGMGGHNLHGDVNIANLAQAFQILAVPLGQFHDLSVAFSLGFGDGEDVDSLGERVHHADPQGIVPHLGGLVVLEFARLQVEIEFPGVGVNVLFCVVGWDLPGQEHVQGGKTLLSVQDDRDRAQFGVIGIQVLQFGRMGRLPKEKRADGVLFEQRHHQLLGLFATPHVFPLEFGKDKVAVADIGHEFGDFGHGDALQGQISSNSLPCCPLSRTARRTRSRPARKPSSSFFSLLAMGRVSEMAWATR